jgi:hypothetical protein
VVRYADRADCLGLRFFNPTTQDRGQRVPCLSQVPVGQQLHRNLDISEHRRALRAFLPGAAQEARISSVRCRGVYAWGVYGRGASGRGAATVVVPAGGPTVMAGGCSGHGLPAARGDL